MEAAFFSYGLVFNYAGCDCSGVGARDIFTVAGIQLAG
jgi:hypothetical protein